MKRARECCMCGDIGFPRELFRCRKCLHRSQHTYCSVLYPHTESYEVCDWCLRTGEDRKTRSCHASESRCFGKCAAIGAADDERKQELRGCNDCQGSFPLQHSVRIIRQNSMDKAAVAAHCSTQNVALTANPHANCAKGRKSILNERLNTRKADTIQHGQNQKLDSVRGGCKIRCRMNTKSRMPDAKVSTPRPCRGKARRYKLLEEVSS